MDKRLEEKMEYISLLSLNKTKADLISAVRYAEEELGLFIIYRLKKSQVIPFDEGDLQNSMQVEVVDNGLIVSWNTPYARRRYYENANIKRSKNKNAQNRWFDTYLRKGSKDYNICYNFFLDKIIEQLE